MIGHPLQPARPARLRDSSRIDAKELQRLDCDHGVLDLMLAGKRAFDPAPIDDEAAPTGGEVELFEMLIRSAGESYAQFAGASLEHLAGLQTLGREYSRNT